MLDACEGSAQSVYPYEAYPRCALLAARPTGVSGTGEGRRADLEKLLNNGLLCLKLVPACTSPR